MTLQEIHQTLEGMMGRHFIYMFKQIFIKHYTIDEEEQKFVIITDFTEIKGSFAGAKLLLNSFKAIDSKSFDAPVQKAVLAQQTLSSYDENNLSFDVGPVVIYQTTDYSIFRKLEGNRQTNQRKILRIIKEIKGGNDMLKYYPIQVKKANDDLLDVLGGQNRLIINEMLKRPVYFILVEEEKTMSEIARVNSNVEKWKTKDFINCYIEKGINDYKMLREFMDTYNFTATVSIKLLTTGNPGTESGLGNNYDFQQGLFKVKYWEQALELAETCKCFDSFPEWRSRAFVIAIYRIIQAGKCTIDELVERYNKFPTMLTVQNGFKEYIFNLESLFNKGKQIRQVFY